jgi:zinc carboxypeptidase
MAYPSSIANIETRIQTLLTTFPTICTRIPLLRRTYEGGTAASPGREVSCVRIGTGTGEGRPRILIVAGVHAREWAPPDAVLTFIEKLLAAYDPRTPRAMVYAAVRNRQSGRTPQVVNFKRFTIPATDVQLIVERTELYVIPLANPDGRAFTLASRTQRGWRKNRRPAPTGVTCPPLPTGLSEEDRAFLFNDAIGVDINRNFPIAWDINTFYSSAALSSGAVSDNTDPCDLSQLFRGPSAGSEPETANIQQILNDHNINFYMDVHSAAGKFLFAWGMARNQTSDTAQTFKNTALDAPGGTGRNPTGTTPSYAEWIPPGRERELQMLGDNMGDAILDSTGYTRVEATPDPVTGVAPNPEAQEAYHRSRYVAVQSIFLFSSPSGTPEFSTGISRDFAFSRQIGATTGTPIRATALDPIFSYTFECGRPEDGAFHPHHTNQYPKIEREVAAGLWKFMSYAATWRAPVPSRPTTPPTPPSPPPSSGGTPGGGTHCLLSSAFHGERLHPQLIYLRQVRAHLKTTAWGLPAVNAIERVYYSLSPPLARYVQRHSFAAMLVRAGIVAPTVAVLRAALPRLS